LGKAVEVLTQMTKKAPEVSQKIVNAGVKELRYYLDNPRN